MASTNRTGRVSSIDYESGTYEVTYTDRGQSVTKKINAISNGEYLMPKIGQTVSVSHQSNGTAQATTTGTIWNETNKPAEGYEGLYRKEYSNTQGQAYDRYDANTGVYTQYVDKQTGRVCNGAIYDEAKGSVTTVAGGQLQLKSTGASVGIQAKTGVGISAGTTVSLEAGTYMSLEATGDVSISSGGEYTQEVAGKASETYNGAVTKSYQSTLKETMAGKTSRSYSAAVSEEYEEEAERTYSAEVTEEYAEKVSKTYSGGVEATAEGQVKLSVNGTEIIVYSSGAISVSAGGAEITISTAGNVSITSPTKISLSAPDVSITGDSGDVSINGVSLVSHTHADEGSGAPNR